MTPSRAVLVALSCTVAIATAYTPPPQPLTDAFINLINIKQDTWKAGRNFPPHTNIEDIKKLMGALPDENIKKLKSIQHSRTVIDSLPENFDPSDKWPNCPTLNEIIDQGSCGSCWAIGASRAVEAMTDRVCTYSNGTSHFHFFAEDLLTCCTRCGHGCNGGKPSSAWRYWKNVGIVSGGSYNSGEGCAPYEIPPYNNNNKFFSGNRMHAITPKCRKTCQKDYNVPYKKDKRYGKHIFSVRGEDNIKAELFKNGPVEAVFTVYADFLQYQSGVYIHATGDVTGHHAIKMLGWGVEDGTKYWLIANSWGADWGDNGFFKILRGENHCDIENSIVAGEPLLD